MSTATYSLRRGDMSRSTPTIAAKMPSTTMRIVVGVSPKTGPVAKRLIKERAMAAGSKRSGF